MKTISETRSSGKKTKIASVTAFLAAQAALAIISSGCSQDAADKSEKPKSEPIVALAPMPNLEKQLSDLREKNKEGAPASVLEVGERQRQALLKSGILETALNVGDAAPEFELPNAVGIMIKSSEILAHGPMVLTFYRGSWCPYCNLQLKNLQDALPHFKAAGVSLVAVSPQPPDSSMSLVEKYDLGFEVLSDKNNELAKQFGVAYQMTPELDSLVRVFGLDLRVFNESEKAELPLAVTYGIGSDGLIKYAFVDVDYTKRAEPAEILTALQPS